MTYEFNTLGIIFTSVIGLLALLCIDGIILFSIGYKKRTVHTILYRIFAYILIILLLAVAALYLCYKFEVLSLRDVHQLMTLAFTGRQLLDFPREYIVDVFALFDTGLARIFIVATFVLALLSLILSYVRRYKAGFETGENDDAILPEDSEELALEDNDAEKEPEVIVAVPIEEALDEETPAEKETPAEEAAMVEEAAPVEEEVIVEKASTEESTEVIEEPTEEMATETTNEPVEVADLDEAIEPPAEEAVEQHVEPVVEPVEELKEEAEEIEDAPAETQEPAMDVVDSNEEEIALEEKSEEVVSQADEQNSAPESTDGQVQDEPEIKEEPDTIAKESLEGIEEDSESKEEPSETAIEQESKAEEEVSADDKQSTDNNVLAEEAEFAPNQIDEEAAASIDEKEKEEPATIPQPRKNQWESIIGQTSDKKASSAVQMPSRSGFHPIEKKVEPTPSKAKPVEKEQSPSDSKEAPKPSESEKRNVPVTRRMVIANRRNVVNMFNDYLNEKSQEERDKLNASITKITIK